MLRLVGVLLITVFWLLTWAGIITIVQAQQPQSSPPTVQDMQRIITVLEAQRTSALTNHAIAAAKAEGLAEEVAKLKTEIEELKKKPDGEEKRLKN